MSSKVTYRRASVEDAFAISSLIRETFITNVAPQNTEKGSFFFVRVQSPSYFRKKIPEIISMYVAEDKHNIIGEIALMGGLSSFFVLPEYQKQGIGKKLLSLALPEWIGRTGNKVITVNSSPNAVEIYKKLGFAQNGDETIENDIRCVPLIADVKVLLEKLN